MLLLFVLSFSSSSSSFSAAFATLAVSAPPPAPAPRHAQDAEGKQHRLPSHLTLFILDNLVSAFACRRHCLESSTRSAQCARKCSTFDCPGLLLVYVEETENGLNLLLHFCF